MGGNGGTKSGKTWLSACGPPVEMPMTKHSGLEADAGIGGGVADRLGGRDGERDVTPLVEGDVVEEEVLDELAVRRGRRTRLCAAASTLPTSRSRLARISASWLRSGLAMKSTAPSSSACKVTSAPSCVKALTMTTGTGCTA